MLSLFLIFRRTSQSPYNISHNYGLSLRPNNHIYPEKRTSRRSRKFQETERKAGTSPLAYHPQAVDGDRVVYNPGYADSHFHNPYPWNRNAHEFN